MGVHKVFLRHGAGVGDVRLSQRGKKSIKSARGVTSSRGGSLRGKNSPLYRSLKYRCKKQDTLGGEGGGKTHLST